MDKVRTIWPGAGRLFQGAYVNQETLVSGLNHEKPIVVHTAQSSKDRLLSLAKQEQREGKVVNKRVSKYAQVNLVNKIAQKTTEQVGQYFDDVLCGKKRP